MDFRLNEEELAFRDEVREFIRRELTPEVQATCRDHSEQGMWAVEYTRAFRRKLGEAGYIGMGWPEAYGGGGRNRIYQMILWEEMEYHRAPGLDRSITYVPNAVMAFGTQEQKSLLLPAIMRGELSWFVGYSEPGAGSDLASLSTVAVEDGEDFVITGQKAFSSDAHMADYGWVATRTDPGEKKHQGLSMFIVDMSLPGVEITRTETLAGWTHHSVYFKNVRVPRSMLVGERGGGWKIIMGAIDFERAALAAPGLVRMQLDRLIDFAGRDLDGPKAIEDPVVRDQICELEIEAEGARLMAYEVVSMQSRGLSPQHETSLAMLAKRETVRALDVFGLEMLGQAAPLRAGSEQTLLGGDVELEYRDHLYFQFAAGGFDIARNVLASRGLGLPR